jgi:hypothetical protein
MCISKNRGDDILGKRFVESFGTGSVKEEIIGGGGTRRGGGRVLFERKEIKEEEEGGSLWKQGC